MEMIALDIGYFQLDMYIVYKVIKLKPASLWE